MTANDPASAVIRYVEAVRDGDLDAVRDVFADDVTWDYPGDLPLSGTWRGRETIVADFLGGVRTLLEPAHGWASSSPASSARVIRRWPSGPRGAPPAAAPCTTTAASASSPSGTGRSPRSGSTWTPSTSRALFPDARPQELAGQR